MSSSLSVIFIFFELQIARTLLHIRLLLIVICYIQNITVLGVKLLVLLHPKFIIERIKDARLCIRCLGNSKFHFKWKSIPLRYHRFELIRTKWWGKWSVLMEHREITLALYFLQFSTNCLYIYHITEYIMLLYYQIYCNNNTIGHKCNNS